MSIDVRHIGPEAATAFHEVMAAAFGARRPLDPPADALGDDVDAVARGLRERGGLLACVDGVPAGCLLLHADDDALVLRRFGVHPRAQGHGVAAALVAAAVEAATGRSRLVVLAREELPETIAFWTRHEFSEVRRSSPYVELHRSLPTSWEVPDADAMRELGERLGRSLVAGDLVVLTGGLGAGKTTLTQGIGHGLQVRGEVTSPTFVIARVHPSLVAGEPLVHPPLVHVDAYRLGGVDELDDLDLDTSVDEAVTVVEWGAGLAEVLSQSRLEVSIHRAVAGDAASDGPDPRRVELFWHGGK